MQPVRSVKHVITGHGRLLLVSPPPHPQSKCGVRRNPLKAKAISGTCGVGFASDLVCAPPRPGATRRPSSPTGRAEEGALPPNPSQRHIIVLPRGHLDLLVP